ncbi:MAG: hypothetical protein FWG13_03260 [Leptospirales bacterium]|nr:hypothetical protein [Leptospirales bacterium]
MALEKIFSDIDSFRAELKRLAVTKIVFAYTKERRAEQTSDEKMEIIPYIRLEVIAYMDAVIYKYAAKDVDLDAMYALFSEDFEVKKVSRNIT